MTHSASAEESNNLVGSGIVLRPARDEDHTLIKSFIRNEHLNPLSLDWRHFWLAESPDGGIIGCGQLKAHGDGSRELASLVVLPGWRGRGVAAALIAKLKLVGGPPLWLTCRSNLVPYYEKFGFADATGSAKLPPYFRRIRRLAGGLMRLARANQRLAVMVWPKQDEPGQSGGQGPGGAKS